MQETEEKDMEIQKHVKRTGMGRVRTHLESMTSSTTKWLAGEALYTHQGLKLAGMAQNYVPVKDL